MSELARTLLALLVLVVVASVVPLVDGVRQARAVAWAATRGGVQLLVVGLVLGRCSAPHWRCCPCSA
jgi:ABC-type iron transport system FetAB permease component